VQPDLWLHPAVFFVAVRDSYPHRPCLTAQPDDPDRVFGCAQCVLMTIAPAIAPEGTSGRMVGARAASIHCAD
jgi:hypothetical protein